MRRVVIFTAGAALVLGSLAIPGMAVAIDRTSTPQENATISAHSAQLDNEITALGKGRGKRHGRHGHGHGYRHGRHRRGFIFWPGYSYWGFPGYGYGHGFGHGFGHRYGFGYGHGYGGYWPGGYWGGGFGCNFDYPCGPPYDEQCRPFRGRPSADPRCQQLTAPAPGQSAQPAPDAGAQPAPAPDAAVQPAPSPAPAQGDTQPRPY
jgi:hypothetical protein